MIKLKKMGQLHFNSQVALDFWRHLLMWIRAVHILRPFIRPLCHQYVMIIICKGLCGLRQETINRISKNPNIPPRILSNTPEKLFIEVLVLFYLKNKKRKTKTRGFKKKSDKYQWMNFKMKKEGENLTLNKSSRSIWIARNLRLATSC